MKKYFLGFIFSILFSNIFADIAPSPIEIKGIFSRSNCKIRMKSEIVRADLFNDSAKVDCEFEMVNYGDSITIEIGFPEMNFQYWSSGEYDINDKKNFKICVDGSILMENQIGVPAEMTSIYNSYMKVYSIDKTYKQKTDSIYKANNITVQKNGSYTYKYEVDYKNAMLSLDSLYKWRDSQPHIDSNLWKEFDNQMKKGNYPWYVWKVHFDRNETKTIKVSYSLPSGQGYGSNYRYFKYILETGSGWYIDIEKADIILKLHNINRKRIEEISPKGYIVDKSQNTITWNLINLEPTKEDDIYLRYYNLKERNHWNIFKFKRKISRKFRFLNMRL